ncbi:MAG: hypothetical protein M3Q12_13465 [Pseudomonadota bacterium]|uniref:hypothetical protein n=1 Tax=Polaromonas sp. TaxID=1869339 RepID=UPI001859CD99|nr:hypothetical protein [Polaromonas sp.]MBA3593032.1 hypothetical protein [Polaromonas sp.]MDQ3273154.1 hypothetical protein [Pseudomonadota bacterium]
MSSEQPILCLGLAGFTPEQTKHLEALLARLPQGLAAWQISAFSEADAWLVSGEKSRLLSADTLKVLAGRPTERTLQINLSEVDRPIAFSLPLAPGNLDPMYTFDPTSVPSLHQMLHKLETRLRSLRCQFVLGGQLIARESQLLPGIYQVSHHGTLLAVMDFHEWRIGISPDAEPPDFELARWDRRPLAARGIPAHFLPNSLSQLRWIYTQRTRRDVLPPRYRSKPVYLRRAPDVPMRWLRDSQLLLLRALSQEISTFERLQQRTGLTAAQLTRDLASLYFAGSITTTPDKAGTGSFVNLDVTAGSAADCAALLAAPAAAAAVGQPRTVTVDPTAPAQLGRK